MRLSALGRTPRPPAAAPIPCIEKLLPEAPIVLEAGSPVQRRLVNALGSKSEGIGDARTGADAAIIASVPFLVIKGMLTLKKRFETEAAAPPKPTPSEIYLKEIRDALVKK